LAIPGNELYLIRKGAVRITLPSPVEEGGHHALTYGRGDFFGGMAFPVADDPSQRCDGARRHRTLRAAARAVRSTPREEHKRLACTLVEELAKVLALRLRYADKELMAMQE
jgi:SulP family sulfate permease